MIIARDGENSGAKVEIYRSTAIEAPGSITNPNNREPFSQEQCERCRHEYGLYLEPDLFDYRERTKELLIVVKRGKDADIVEHSNPPFDEPWYLKKWSSGMTWAELKKATFWHDKDHEARESRRNNIPVLMDTYADMEDYQWPPEWVLYLEPEMG